MGRYLGILIVAAAFGLGAGYVYLHRNPASAPTADAVPSVKPPELVGATLLPGLGNYSFPVTSANPDVQKWFDQGLILTYGFNHEAAERSFLKAAELDPDCAMCWWGSALVLGPHVNAPMNPANNEKAWARLAKAKALASKTTPREQAFIDALGARYAQEPPADRAALDKGYADATGVLAQARPDDLDAAVFHAEAMMDLQPWDYYGPRGVPKGNTALIVSTLESVLARNADHAGALHLYIHAVEASTSPGRAVVAADRLAGLLPGSGHLMHMPSHIYTRVGRYHDAVVANQKAIEADDAYLAVCKPGVAIYPLAYVPHNHAFLWWASSMEGASTTAVAAADEVSKRANVPQLVRVPELFFLQDFLIAPLKARIQLGRWDEIAATPKPDADFKYPTAYWHYAQGMAAVRQGRLDEARVHQAELSKAAADPVWASTFIGPHHPIAKTLRIAELVLTGEFAAARKQYPAAIASLRQGVALEDEVVYYEPPLWPAPVRHNLGAVQLSAGDAKGAEATYREDLRLNPENGWSLFGLAKSLRAQKREDEAQKVDVQFAKAWAHADLELDDSRL